ncbi:MAG: hypothetical protein EBR28_00765 [Planctomycetia bacterium]|nr:hypothetical protein [Planctomycetia bacterium]
MRRHLVWSVVAVVVLGGAGGRAEDPVIVNITGPLAAKVGERVSFEVELVNRSGRPLPGLRVVDYFDKGFHHEASASPIEQKGTIDLAAGTTRRITLDFLLDEPGRQCHRVEILDQAHKYMGGATECVQVAAAAPVSAAPAPVGPPPVPAALAPAPIVATPPATPAPAVLELHLTAPAEALSGAVAECIATVRNVGNVASSPTNLELTWDGAFSPLEASDGYKLGTGEVSWTVPAVDPGGELRRQINLRPQAAPTSYRESPASRACVRGVLSGLPGGMLVADEACVMVRSTTPRPRTPREAGLRLSLADLDDPVQIGGATTLVCTVTNNGTAPTGRLDMVIVLPDQARIVGDPSPSRVRIDGANVGFDSIPSLPPGGHATFEVSYRVPTAGSVRATAIVTGSELDGSLESTCATAFAAP